MSQHLSDSAFLMMKRMRPSDKYRVSNAELQAMLGDAAHALDAPSLSNSPRNAPPC